MRLQVVQLLRRIKSSYWFWPAVMSATAIALALAAERLDRVVDQELLEGVRWVYSGDPAGARAILSTIASSMVTVAGVVFSITIVAMVLASSQFGPRLLSGFMRDRVNQLVLGTFVATFLYCLILMRSVQDLEGQVFVPHVAVSFGILLAVLSVGVLIFFIHHVAAAIQAPNVVANVGADLNASIERAFESTVDSGRDGPLPDVPETGAVRASDEIAAEDASAEADGARSKEAGDLVLEVAAGRDGYVQFIDYEALEDLAAENTVIVDTRVMLGDFVLPVSPIARVYRRRSNHPESPDAPGSEKSLPQAIRSAFGLGAWRDNVDDSGSLAGQLVEFALRALSPGVADPTTAANCIDRLTVALCIVAGKPAPERVSRAEDGTLLLIKRPLDFPVLLDMAFHPIREHARSETPILARLAHALRNIRAVAQRPGDREAISRHLELVAEAARDLPTPWARTLVLDVVDGGGLGATGFHITRT